MTDACLALRLEGPLQAWGTHSRGREKHTDYYPSKSGIVGLLGSALGIPRGGDFSDLNRLKLWIRIDNPGRVMMDFQSMAYRPDSLTLNSTVMHNPSDDEYQKSRSNNRIFYKSYLQNASFLVLLQGDKTELERYAKALKKPHFFIGLGRRNCIPSKPVLIGVYDSEPAELLQSLQYPSEGGERTIIRDAEPEERGQITQDILGSNDINHRRFGYREVVTETTSPLAHDPLDLLEELERTT